MIILKFPLKRKLLLLFSLAQLTHLPHKQPAAIAGIAVFDKGKRFFQNRPRDGFGQADVNGFMLVVPQGLCQVNPVRLKLAGDVFILQRIEFFENVSYRLHGKKLSAISLQLSAT